MYDIIMTKAAKNDIYGAASYITYHLKNDIAAEHLLSESNKQMNVIRDMPECCSFAPDRFLASEGIRMKMIKKYLLFYIICEESKSIFVMRFLHSSCNWISILTDEVIDNFPPE